MLVINTADVLQRVHGDLAHLGWASMLPPNWKQLDVPPVVVSQGSSDEWILASAIGIVLSRSGGLPELELHDISANDYTIRGYCERATGSSTMYRCDKTDCTFTRPFLVKAHDCIDEAGRTFPVTKRKRATDSTNRSARNRQSQEMRAVGDISFHDLPARIKEWAWASWCSTENRLKITAALFQSVNQGSSSSTALPSPRFGPAKVTKSSNARAPSKRKAERAARVSTADTSGSSSGSSTTRG